MALVTHRFVQQNDPATVLSKHFCKDWVDVDQYSDTFEINFHRKLLLYSNLAVNTWFRCKSGDRELEAFDAPPQKVPGILLETDINTLSEMKDSAVFNPSEQLVFFRAAVVQSDSLVRAYFSERKSG